LKNLGVWAVLGIERRSGEGHRHTHRGSEGPIATWIQSLFGPGKQSKEMTDSTKSHSMSGEEYHGGMEGAAARK
jgi:hypothetical protein